MSIVITICFFLLTVLLMGQLFRAMTWKQHTLEKRLKAVTRQSHRQGEKVDQLMQPGTPVKWLRSMSIPGSIVGKRYLERLQSILTKAGMPLKAEEMITLCIVSGIFLALVGTVAVGLSIGVMCGVIGLLGPTIWVSYLLRTRNNRIEAQLLDTVVLLANSLRGGHSFMQALELVSRETLPPLSEEFGRVVRETKVGISTEAALNNLKNRVQSEDLEIVITGVLLQRQVGGNLAQVLDTVADTIDKRIRMRGKIKTLTAQGKLTGWIIGLLPFGLAAMVFGKYPEFGKVMLEEPLGLMMLGGGGAMLLVGILLIRKVVNIDV